MAVQSPQCGFPTFSGELQLGRVHCRLFIQECGLSRVHCRVFLQECRPEKVDCRLFPPHRRAGTAGVLDRKLPHPGRLPTFSPKSLVLLDFSETAFFPLGVGLIPRLAAQQRRRMYETATVCRHREHLKCHGRERSPDRRVARPGGRAAPDPRVPRPGSCPLQRAGRRGCSRPSFFSPSPSRRAPFTPQSEWPVPPRFPIECPYGNHSSMSRDGPLILLAGIRRIPRCANPPSSVSP